MYEKEFEAYRKASHNLLNKICDDVIKGKEHVRGYRLVMISDVLTASVNTIAHCLGINMKEGDANG